MMKLKTCCVTNNNKQHNISNKHSNDNIPVVLAGHGGGAFTPGRHVDLGKKTPMSNLYVRMLHEFGVPSSDFGDSNGMLKKA